MFMSAVEVRQSQPFQDWLHRLRDDRAKARIVMRIRRMELGNPGDTQQLGGGLVEMRIDYGPGYRIYFTHRDGPIVVLLCRGDKQSQRRDIEKARVILQELER
jgi:putative addiction module killer protein